MICQFAGDLGMHTNRAKKSSWVSLSTEAMEQIFGFGECVQVQGILIAHDFKVYKCTVAVWVHSLCMLDLDLDSFELYF